MKFPIRLIILTCFIYALPIGASAQLSSYGQFWNEFAFTRSIGTRWALELNLGQAWSGSESEKGNIFSHNAQLYARLWIHYYASPRWKLSYFYAYYDNKEVPEIDQRTYAELRSAFQGIYYIKKTNYTLNTRVRVEDRHVSDTNGDFEASYRFRAQLRLVYPLNGKFLRQGVYYGLASEEVFFKTASSVTGNQFFDRNRLTLGFGYNFTDDFQVELSYANEWLPRPSRSEMIHAIQLNFVFNNLWQNLSNRWKAHREHNQHSDDE